MLVSLAITVFLFVKIDCYDISPPIPMLDEEKGIRYPLTATAKGKVRLEAFIELICPDSLAALPVLKQVAEHYGPEKIEVIFNQLPLPYHRNAFIATQGLFVIQNRAPTRVFDYIEKILTNWFMLSTSATRNLIDSEVLDLIAQYAESSTGVSEIVFKAEIGNYGFDTVKIWKYGVNRGVAGTPWFFVNGIDIAVNPSDRLSFEDWRRFLDPLVE